MIEKLNETKIFKDFETFLLASYELKASSLVLTLPGLGTSFLSDQFAEKHREDLQTKRVTSVKEELSAFNIIDLDFEANDNALDEAEEIFKHAQHRKHLALIVETPHILKSGEFKKSLIAERVYKSYPFKVFDQQTTSVFLEFINPELSADQVKAIQKRTDGIARFAKYFAVNPQNLKKTNEKLYEDPIFNMLTVPIASTIQKTDPDVLLQMGIDKKDKFISSMLKAHEEISVKTAISVHKDLTFSEDGEKSDEELIKVEKEILQQALKEGVVTREAIAEAKWGPESYDEYSDQAITKTVQRLNNKLRHHELEAIPKVSYKLIRKESAPG